MGNFVGTKMVQTEKRNLLSSVFITIMIGVAYQEMIPSVRDSIRLDGINLPTAILFAIFFLTSIRFFIGNQLHLVNDGLMKMPGLVWLYDLIVIIFQCILFTFMAGVMTVAANQTARVSFFGFLIAIYAIDVVWIFTQWLLGLILPRWRRKFIPWAWGLLNTVLVVAMFATDQLLKDPFSNTALEVMLGINVIGFLIDVMLVDYFDVL
jgi:hypothetical protein